MFPRSILNNTGIGNKVSHRSSRRQEQHGNFRNQKYRANDWNSINDAHQEIANEVVSKKPGRLPCFEVEDVNPNLLFSW